MKSWMHSKRGTQMTVGPAVRAETLRCHVALAGEGRQAFGVPTRQNEGAEYVMAGHGSSSRTRPQLRNRASGHWLMPSTPSPIASWRAHDGKPRTLKQRADRSGAKMPRTRHAAMTTGGLAGQTGGITMTRQLGDSVAGKGAWQDAACLSAVPRWSQRTQASLCMEETLP